MIAEEKHKKVMGFLKIKTYEIWKHENEVRKEKGEPELEGYQEGFSIEDCFCIAKDGIMIYFAFNSSFLNTILENLMTAIDNYSSSFGTDDATDVINALYNVSKTNTLFSKDEYISHLKNYACCYIIFEKEQTQQFEILRLDILRKMKEKGNDSNKKDFIGGLLHSLKHFSIDGQNLSTGKDINDVYNVSNILGNIAYAFAKYIQKNVSSDNIVIQEENKKQIKYVFYKEETAGIYYLTTCHRVTNANHATPTT